MGLLFLLVFFSSPLVSFHRALVLFCFGLFGLVRFGLVRFGWFLIALLGRGW